MFEIDLNSDLKENKVNMSPGFIKKKRYIIDVLQGSEYSSGSEYTRILNMTGLHKVIKKCSTINA